MKLNASRFLAAATLIVGLAAPACAVTYRGFGKLPGGIKVKLKLSGAFASTASSSLKTFQGALRCSPVKTGMCIGRHAPVSGERDDTESTLSATVGYPTATTNCGLSATYTTSCQFGDGTTYSSSDPNKLLCGSLACYQEGGSVDNAYRSFAVVLRLPSGVAQLRQVTLVRRRGLW
jgi:hypothetical protein